jgi:hypothetical protein
MMDECDVDPEDDVIHFDSSLYHHPHPSRQVSGQTSNSSNDYHSSRYHSEGHHGGQSHRKSISIQSTWKTLRKSFAHSKPSSTSTTPQHISEPTSSAVRRSSLPSPASAPFSSSSSSSTSSSSVSMKRNIPGSRSSNNIADMVIYEEENTGEENKEDLAGAGLATASGSYGARDSDRESFRHTRQRGVSISSKQEASLLLSLQNSPSTRQRLEREHAKKTSATAVGRTSTNSTAASSASSNANAAGGERERANQSQQQLQSQHTTPHHQRHSQSSQRAESQSAPQPQRRKSHKSSSDGCLPS